MSMTTGNMSAISRPTCSAVAVRAVFASSKRSTSYGSRTKARTTRMPVICSRRTRLTVSMRFCMTLNAGTMRTTTKPMLSASAGTAIPRSHDSPKSSRRAMTMPPTHMMGAITRMVQPIRTTICTC